MILSTDSSCLGRSWCSVSCYWWARSAHFSAMTLPICSQNCKTCTVFVVIHCFPCSSVSTTLYFICKIPPAPEPLKEYTVGNYMVYASLHVIVWREQLAGGCCQLWERTWEWGCRKKKILETACIWTSRTRIWMAGSWLVLQSHSIC